MSLINCERLKILASILLIGIFQDQLFYLNSAILQNIGSFIV